MTIPDINEGDLIKVGNIPAVVSVIRGPGDVEVVYLDLRKLALAEDAVWRNDEWAFKTPGGAVARFVDRKERMKPFIETLRGLHKPATLTFPGKTKRKK